MKENWQMIKNWFSIARPVKKDYIWQFITYIIHAVCFVIAPIYVAKVTSTLATHPNCNYEIALFYLCLVFVLLVIRNIAMIINYKNSNKVFDGIFLPLQNKIVNKIVSASDENFGKYNKEKILNIYHTASYTVTVFGSTLAKGTSKLLRLIITLFVIFFINPYIALVILAVDVLNFFILNHLYARIANYNKAINEGKDIQNEKLSDIYDGKDILNEMKLKAKAEKSFMSVSAKISDLYCQRTMCQSKIDNNYFVFYSAVVFIIQFVLIILLWKTNLTLENYLVIVPYLTTGITDANEFYSMFTDLKTANIHANRLKAILNFTDKELIEYGKTNLDDITGSVDFYNVSYKPPRGEKTKTPAIKNISFHIEENENTLILGGRGCGKRTIFYLLRRHLVPLDGKIIIGGINSKDYSEKIYNNNFTYCTTKPFFFRGSILKNFKMVENSHTKIFDMCKKLGIYEDIMKLPKKFSASPKDATLDIQYLIAFCRSLLTRSEIIVLYEFPSYLSDKQRERICQALIAIKDNRTLITFSASEYCANFSNKIIYIENGEVKNIYFNKIKEADSE